MNKKTYIILDRYGLFVRYNEFDLKQMNDMAKKGYEIWKETLGKRIYKLKSKNEVKNG